MKCNTVEPEDVTFTSLLQVLSELGEVLMVKTVARDIKTLQARRMSEGRSFVSKTLPLLGKAFDQALQGISPFKSLAFKRAKGCIYPAFLSGFSERVFDCRGVVRPPSDIPTSAIKAMRQVLFYGYKEETKFTEGQIQEAVDTFVDVDDCLPNPGDPVPVDWRETLHFANCLVQNVLRDVNPLEIQPGHGPGAVASGEDAWEKMDFRRIYRQINEVYPFQRYFFLSWAHLNCSPHKDYLVRVDEGRSRQVLVNKDSRGPRKISMEPLEYQWIQQGLKGLLYEVIESHPLTKGHVNFTSQEVNRNLARWASRNKSFVTLDLKDASDRVSLWLVENLFDGTEILRALRATRTKSMALVQESSDGRENLVLKKFAPMGSAVCFPVEALSFWAIIVACLVVKAKLPITLVCRNVWVFGDDIILRSGWEDFVIPALEAFSLEVNKTKSCLHGYFRESCGVDAFYGQEVQPLRVKSPFPRSVMDSSGLLSWMDLSRQFMERGLVLTSKFISDKLEKILGELPILPIGSPDPGFHHLWGDVPHPVFPRSVKVRNIPCQQSYAARLWVTTTEQVKASPVWNWSALLLALISGEDKAKESFARPKSPRLVKRWVHLHGMPVAVTV